MNATKKSDFSYVKNVLMAKIKERKRWIIIIFLVVFVITINVVSYFPADVEKFYSTGIYQIIAIIFRGLTGWIPFSIGDIMYTACGIYIITRIFRNTIILIKGKVTAKGILQSFKRTVIIFLSVYVLFYLLWGLNYSRLGIAYQLKLPPVKYTKADLQSTIIEIIKKVNDSKRELNYSAAQTLSYKEFFSISGQAYKNAVKTYPFLHYSVLSVKPSLYGNVGNYLGFLGYYNPFTGEAQVNTTVPSFIIPYTICHEMAHQIGYGTEDEANFAGYLAAKSSKDLRFLYSVYFDLFGYANRELYFQDSVLARQNYLLIDTSVKKDILIYRQFLADHQNPVEPYITMIYSKYLKANNQPNGIETYSDVITWLIAYKKKYGEL